MIQKLLKSESLQMDTLTSLYYIAPVSAGCNMLISIIFESSSVTLDKFLNVGLWPFVLNGIAAVSVVKNTSTLTLGLAGVLKDILIVGMAMLFYGTPMTLLQAFGYTMAMTGLMYYKNGKDVFGPSVLHYRQVAQIGLLLMAVASCVLLYRVKDEVQYVDQTAACADRVVQLTVVQSAHIGLPAPEGFPTSDKVAVIVETRALPTLVPLIMHFAGVLAWDWHCWFLSDDRSLVVYQRLFIRFGRKRRVVMRKVYLGGWVLACSNPIQRMIESGKLNMTLIPPLIEMGNGELTSRFMTDPWLWSQIQQENDFFEYDYVGAPWPASDESGNGGLSLRKRSHTLRCIREQPRKPGMAEDVYFSRTLQSIGALVAPRDVSAAFSVEAEFEAEPLGCENFAGYEDTSYTARMQAQYTDVILLNKHEHLDEVLDRVNDLNTDTVKVRCEEKAGVHPDLVFGLDTKLFQLSGSAPPDDAGCCCSTISSPPSGDDDGRRAECTRHIRRDGLIDERHHDRELDLVKIHRRLSPPGRSLATVGEFEAFLAALPKEDVYRVKGLARLEPGAGGTPALYIVNWAFGRTSLVPVTRTVEDEERKSLQYRITVMGVDLLVHKDRIVRGLCLDAAEVSLHLRRAA
ncbi:MAG: hypothetical protein BJ554DRAFT_8268 [Olpidium bornovanus]|uniref:GDP-mannose transporter n=1 Tax=Olpidium bornovanus TaxID=278681 RepID=A0A8H7ZUY1_9FUNG|nr:MAG: hypothetical protein BJ554DRAFT_8268 [Olpidium bornovanus]